MSLGTQSEGFPKSLILKSNDRDRDLDKISNGSLRVSVSELAPDTEKNYSRLLPRRSDTQALTVEDDVSENETYYEKIRYCFYSLIDSEFWTRFNPLENLRWGCPLPPH